MPYNGRKSCMWSLIERRPTKFAVLSTRNKELSYQLILANGNKVNVCKLFFLATLSYPPTSSVVHELMKSSPSKILPDGDKRGKHEPAHAITELEADVIKKHIMSFNPCISHYRREHAPRQLYLPSELTEKEMHNDFMRTYPQAKCSYVSYTRYVRQMRISFVKLGEEQCELCLELDERKHQMTENGDHDVQTCEVCKLKEEPNRREES